MVNVLIQLLHDHVLHEILPWKHIWEQSLLRYFWSYCIHSFRGDGEIYDNRQRVLISLPDIFIRRGAVLDVREYHRFDPDLYLLEPYGSDYGLQYGVYQCAKTVPNQVLIDSLCSGQPFRAFDSMLCPDRGWNPKSSSFHCILICYWHLCFRNTSFERDRRKWIDIKQRSDLGLRLESCC